VRGQREDLNDNGEKEVLHEQKDDEEVEDDINNELDPQGLRDFALGNPVLGEIAEHHPAHNVAPSGGLAIVSLPPGFRLEGCRCRKAAQQM
jgi:hypothetical protein